MKTPARTLFVVMSALILLPAPAVAKVKITDLVCEPGEIPKFDGVNWVCSDDLFSLSQAIAEISGFGCSAQQQDNSVLISCGDGTAGVIAGAGTVVMYPEGQIGQVPPIDYSTGPIVVFDGSGIVLGETISFCEACLPGNDVFDIFLDESRSLRARLISAHSTQKVLFLPAATTVYFLSDDCSGPAFSADSGGPWTIDNRLSVAKPGPAERLLFGSYYHGGWWDVVDGEAKYYAPNPTCYTYSTIKSARRIVEYFLAPEITNAAYPLRVEQLP